MLEGGRPRLGFPCGFPFGRERPGCCGVGVCGKGGASSGEVEEVGEPVEREGAWAVVESKGEGVGVVVRSWREVVAEKE